MSGRSSASHEFVAGIGNQRSACVADKSNRTVSKPGNDPHPFFVARMVIIAAHRDPSPDVLQELSCDTGVFCENSIGISQGVGGARRQIPQISDRCCNDVQSWRQKVTHQPRLTASHSIEKESSFRLSSNIRGDGSMIGVIAVPAIALSLLQASVVAPTQSFRGCLRDAATKASDEKVSGDNIEAYLKNACTIQMGALREALIAFRLKNGMNHKNAAADADMTVDDYVSTPADNYKFTINYNPSKPTAAATPAAAAKQASPQLPKP
jgi:hypothetical protein